MEELTGEWFSILAALIMSCSFMVGIQGLKKSDVFNDSDSEEENFDHQDELMISTENSPESSFAETPRWMNPLLDQRLYTVGPPFIDGKEQNINHQDDLMISGESSPESLFPEIPCWFIPSLDMQKGEDQRLYSFGASSIDPSHWMESLQQMLFNDCDDHQNLTSGTDWDFLFQKLQDQLKLILDK